MMEVEINDKTYPFLFKGDNEIEIFLEDVNDVLFFKNWSNQVYDQKTFEIKPKVQYIKDIKYTTITQKGILYSCFPIIDINEKSVNIHFDYRHIYRTMTGTLHKTENGWIVRWSDLHSFLYGWMMMDTPLHPDDEKTLMGTVDQIKEWDGMLVEFDYITDHYDEDNLTPVCYAKLLGNIIDNG